MSNYFFYIQTYPFSIFTFITKHFLFTLFRAKPVIPTIRTLWKIAPVLSSSGIYIFSSPKHRKETYCHFLCNIRWIYNTIPLIQVIFFCTFYFFFKRIHLFIGNACFPYYFVTDPGNLVAKKKKFFQYYLLLFPILLPTKDHQQNSLHA